jgi:hypothetical protein
MLEHLATPNEPRSGVRHEHGSDFLPDLMRRILEAERNQKADEARIEEAIRQAEVGMAAAL